MKKYLEKKQNAESSTLHTLAICSSLEAIEHIQVGSFYEIDHSKLPPKAPEQFRSIRIVMVSKKALFKVSVRFPSIHSLQAFLGELEMSYGNVGGQKNELPALDEKYLLDPEAASEVLYRRVPPEEISDRRKVWSFWAVITRRRFENLVRNPSGRSCLSEVNLSGLVQWGRRKQVRYLSSNRSSPIPSSSEDEENDKLALAVRDEEDDELGDETSEEEEAEASPRVLVKKNTRSKRRKQPIKTQKTPKRPKRQKQIVVHNQSEKRTVKSTVARWSAGRYKLAEENMLKVMKDRGATAVHPIKRPALRNEARKLIGDTGLLDHLLKHMAGKVAPGGADRFRRRHNADGAMEYWLESADLVEIRKEAGVQDPYWTPPQGWKPGDNPTQDPTCATMFKELWDEIANLKKRDKELKQPDQGLAMVTTTSNSLLTSLAWDQAYSSVIHLKDKYTQLAVRKSKFEEQMQQASQTLSGMEEEMLVLKSTMEAPGPALMYQSEAADVPQLTSDSEREAKEDKAAKLERLRSGFSIFRPQGTFLWPNMSMYTSQHQIDPSAVPTTPSVTCSTKPATQLDLVPAQAQHGTNPGSGSGSGSLVKPFAERRPVNTSTLLCNVTNPPCFSSAFTLVPSEIEKTTTKSQSAKTLQINLNEIPADAQHNDSNAISRTVTYQRRHQLMKARKENNADARKDSMSLRGHSKSKQHQQRW